MAAQPFGEPATPSNFVSAVLLGALQPVNQVINEGV